MHSQVLQKYRVKYICSDRMYKHSVCTAPLLQLPVVFSIGRPIDGHVVMAVPVGPDPVERGCAGAVGREPALQPHRLPLLHVDGGLALRRGAGAQRGGREEQQTWNGNE